jgi:CubicO group peptidase (beta-lactamase class C family)
MQNLRFQWNRRASKQGRYPLNLQRRHFLRRSVASVFGLAYGRVVLADDHAPQPSQASKASPPMTGQDVPELESFDRFMRGFIVDEHLPGAALAISRGNRLVYARGFGLADRETGKPVEPTSLFRLASVSKPFTATAVLQLVDRKMLHLDDRIWNVLRLSEPKWKGARFDPRWKDITVHELLQHRGGWDRDKSFDPISRMHDIAQKLGIKLPVRPEHILRYMLGFPFDFPPGERYAYSNFGYILLGLAIHQITGREYEEYIRCEVLSRLGIHQMRLGHALLEERAKGEVKYYDSHNRTGSAVSGPQIGQTVPLPYGAENFEAFVAHGGWIASAPELVRFAAALDDPEHCPVLSAKSIETMFARPPGLAGHDANGRPIDSYYGCGWSVRPVGNKGKFNSWHTGLIAGTSTLLVRRFDRLHWAVLFNTEANPAGKQPASLIDPLMHGVSDKVRHWPDREISVAE